MPALGQLAVNTEVEVPKEDDTFKPIFKPSLHISTLQGGIVIDGEMNDAGWQNAAKAINFSENFPEEQAKPPIGIVTYFTL